jgi:hypothetical protein
VPDEERVDRQQIAAVVGELHPVLTGHRP